jgi:hypothetical protein
LRECPSAQLFPLPDEFVMRFVCLEKNGANEDDVFNIEEITLHSESIRNVFTEVEFGFINVSGDFVSKISEVNVVIVVPA